MSCFLIIPELCTSLSEDGLLYILIIKKNSQQNTEMEKNFFKKKT